MTKYREVEPTELDSQVGLMFCREAGEVADGLTLTTGFYIGMATALKHPEWAAYIVQQTNVPPEGLDFGDDIVEAVPIAHSDS